MNNRHSGCIRRRAHPEAQSEASRAPRGVWELGGVLGVRAFGARLLLHYNTIHYITIHYITLHYITLRYIILH